MLFKMMKRLKKEEKGFTLIELLAVIVILAVIAAIAVPYILGVIEKSKEDSDTATFAQIYQAARLYVTSELDSDSKSKTIDVIANSTDTSKGLQAQKYLETPIVLPSTKTNITGGQVVFKADGTLDYITIVNGTKTWKLDGTAVLAGKGKKADVTP